MWLNYCLLVTFLGLVQTKTDVKSSLVFVIDDTGSMSDDIEQVKENVNLVFDSVLYSNESQIDNFILVTFNDPDTELLAITKDRATFKDALASISVHGGGNCPEYSMTGIEQALNVSHPGSYIYVFTDATAEDHEKLEEVQNLAVSKQSQVVFLLTGHCHKSSSSPDYAAYYTISKATDGRVFHMNKLNVGEVLKYISDSVKNRASTLLKKELPPGSSSVTYAVDSTIKDTTVILNGDSKEDVKLSIYSPNGTIAETEHIVDIPSTKIVKIKDPETGNYTAEVDSPSGSTLSVTAKTTFSFLHGFSLLKPSSLNATSIRPIAGLSSNILIQLETPDDIELKSIDIVDLDDNLIMNFGVEILVDSTKTYYASGFVPTSKSFKIVVNVRNHKTNEEFKRHSKPIEPQKPELVKVLPRSPTVTILEGYNVAADYKKPLQLNCIVDGYPQPHVFWEDVETGLEMPSDFSVLEPPYRYTSTLNLANVEKNGKYKCTGTTGGVYDSKTIEVSIKTTFEVIETPKDIYEVNYNKGVTIPCKVNANPLASVTWYFKDKILRSDSDIDVSDDKITIRRMRPDMEGAYSCDVQNELHRNVTNFNIRITGLERPVIIKDIKSVTVLQGFDVTLNCRLLAGTPTPLLKWSKLPEGSDRYVDMKEVDSTIIIKDVKEEDAGTFTCVASNAAGSDYHYIKLNVEYPPIIQGGNDTVNAIDGTSQMLYCPSKGNPKPHVSWTFNGKIVLPDRDHQIYRDGSLKIKASIASGGHYKCEARNKHGTAEKDIEVQYVVPVSILIPNRSTIDTRVGRGIRLGCRANGFPEPEIEWTFRSLDPAVRTKVLSADRDGTISVKHVRSEDDGFYTCNARNIAGASNITYQVNVNSPPIIEKAKTSKIYRAVEGDLIVHIPCKATGKPKPAIIWSYNDHNIARGTEWYDIQDDGTLIIKNVDIKSRGYHTCKATNYLGSDQNLYYVDVMSAPNEETPTSTVVLNRGDKIVVNCSVPLKVESRLRWYKDQKLISNGELVIDDAKAEDTGVYTCRVSDFVGSQSASVEVVVKSAPEFANEAETAIDFEENSWVELDCSSFAEPEAKIEWYFNKNKIDIEHDIYFFQMQYTNIGEYSCVVSNEIGNIHRTFVIESRACALHIQNDFGGNLPLMVLSSDLSIKTLGDYMYIPRNIQVQLSCPGEFTTIRKSRIIATCIENSDFLVDGNVYKFADLKCTSQRIPKIVKKSFGCSHGSTVLVDVGFETGGTFSPVYEVCLDTINNMSVFTKLILQPRLSGVSPKHVVWFNSTYVPFDFEKLYNCERQNMETSASLKRWFYEHDKCCFGKRQLVSPKDVMPGLSQVATYSNLNIVPQWSSCDSENWMDVEDRIRSLAKSTTNNLLLWTGQAGQVYMRDSSNVTDVGIEINDGFKKQPVPRYLWKIIKDPGSYSSLAVIQLNDPDLTLEEANTLVVCNDICDKIPWMADGSWHDVNKGFTFCCTTREFENVFGYKNHRFSHGADHVLTDVSYISTHALS